MSKEFNLTKGWRRHYEKDQPALIGDERSDGTKPTIPQQIAFITPDGAWVQMSYENALRHGLIDESEERWEMSHEKYLRENNE